MNEDKKQLFEYEINKRLTSLEDLTEERLKLIEDFFSKIINKIVDRVVILEKLINEIQFIDNKVEKQKIPDSFIYASEFERKYRFISSVTLTDLAKEFNLKTFEDKNRVYIDPVDVIKLFMSGNLEKSETNRSKIINSFDSFKDILPCLKEIVDKINNENNGN